MVILNRFPTRPRACDRRERLRIDAPLPGLTAAPDEALGETRLDVRESIFIPTGRWSRLLDYLLSEVKEALVL